MSDYDSDQGSYRGGSGSEPEVIIMDCGVRIYV